MLVDIKAHLIKSDTAKQTNQFQALQDTLRGKDFEASLQTHLFACMLSPNLTAYVTDTQQHIMEFIAEHPDIFKVPGSVFDNVELKTLLRKLITKPLASIHSHIKTQLITSIVKQTCIIDVMRNLARSTSGMELEASHWNQMAFLIKWQMQKGNEVDAEVDASDLVSRTEGSISGLDSCDGTGTDEIDTDGALNTEDPTDGINDLDDNDSGFGLDGKCTWFNGQKFWNYVDYMLNLLHDTACKSTTSSKDYEKEVGHIMVQIFQDDLTDCPGSRKGLRLTAVVHPPWQSTIQHRLVW
ncbi:hypothetical protein EDC04DRAFT_2899108 [Pisolithus marmoratus]|nr:hypothetical protein EDC04DRAFT_2899108 [Pisolithus marmoratus]